MTVAAALTGGLDCTAMAAGGPVWPGSKELHLPLWQEAEPAAPTYDADPKELPLWEGQEGSNTADPAAAGWTA